MLAVSLGLVAYGLWLLIGFEGRLAGLMSLLLAGFLAVISLWPASGRPDSVLLISAVWLAVRCSLATSAAGRWTCIAGISSLFGAGCYDLAGSDQLPVGLLAVLATSFYHVAIASLVIAAWQYGRQTSRQIQPSRS